MVGGMKRELVPENLLAGTLFSFQMAGLARPGQALPADGPVPS